jgi:hypothetical protein
MVDRQARKRIQELEEGTVQSDRDVAELSSTVSRLKATIEAIRASHPLLSPAAPSNPLMPAASASSVPATTAPMPLRHRQRRILARLFLRPREHRLPPSLPSRCLRASLP